MKTLKFLLPLFTCGCLVAKAQNNTITCAAGIEFVAVPKGSFIYGHFQPPYPSIDSAKGEYKGYRPQDYLLAKEMATKDAKPGFSITIDKPFYIGKYEVTQQQWNKVMSYNPSVFRGDSLPVDNVTWKEAQRFIAQLNNLDPLHHYRLPTEFEWEYAARAGADDDISWAHIREQAQLGTMSTNPVAQKKPNPWGLYDMLGNVWEWTSDFYNEKIFADEVPPRNGTVHVLKGASFTGDVKNATYMTHAAGPGNGWDIGLRVVMEEKSSSQKLSHRQRTSSKTKFHKSNSPVPGWHLSRTSHQGATPLVSVLNGVITLQQNPYGQGGVLLSDRKYRDFEITVDVKIDSFCNGGIFLRATESGQAYQVELSEPGGTGNLFGEMLPISKPGEIKNKPKVWNANSWNNFKIRMTGEVPAITVWINGEKMYEVQQPKNDFIAGAKEGMIGFQVHWSATYSDAAEAFDMSSSWRPGGKHQFRNLKIAELPAR